MKNLKKKTKIINLPERHLCGKNKGYIEVDFDEGDELYVLKCLCGTEIDHSVHKKLLGAKV